MGEINQSQYEREIDYLYGNFSGKSFLDRKIAKAEEVIKTKIQNEEDLLEKMFDQENLVRLQNMPQKDWTFRDCEIYNEIKKKYTNLGKDFSGGFLQDDTPQRAGEQLDTSALNNKIINTCNGLISKLPAGFTVQPLQQGATLQDILGFVHSFRDALKNGQHPTDEPEIEPESSEVDDQDVPYSLEELLATKIEIEKMIKKLDRSNLG